MILKNHANLPIKKERLNPTSKARREASQNKLVKKGEMPDRVESFGEVDSSKSRPRARLGFVKLIQNGLRKEQSLIESSPFTAETDLARRESGVRFQKEE